jgi:hypothetical protein
MEKRKIREEELSKMVDYRGMKVSELDEIMNSHEMQPAEKISAIVHCRVANMQTYKTADKLMSKAEASFNDPTDLFGRHGFYGKMEGINSHFSVHKFSEEDPTYLVVKSKKIGLPVKCWDGYINHATQSQAREFINKFITERRSAA